MEFPGNYSVFFVVKLEPVGLHFYLNGTPYACFPGCNVKNFRANFLEQIFLRTASEQLWVTGLQKFNDQNVYLYLGIKH